MQKKQKHEGCIEKETKHGHKIKICPNGAEVSVEEL